MRTVAILALAFLAACGGGSGSEPRPPDGLEVGPPLTGAVYVVPVPVGYFPDSRLAEYDEMNGDGWIRVRQDIVDGNADLTRRLIRHELGHALGLSHSADAACVMHPDAFANPTLELCPHEVAHAQAFPITLTVYLSLAPGISGPSHDAADEWNVAAMQPTPIVDVK